MWLYLITASFSLIAICAIVYLIVFYDIEDTSYFWELGILGVINGYAQGRSSLMRSRMKTLIDDLKDGGNE